MKRVSPTISGLQAFEASARHLSFTRAATELCITQSAMSRQIANIEDYLGIELFQRVRKRIVLTEAGRTYLAKIRPALKQLETATIEMLANRGRGGVLNIASLPTIGAKWLIPRLPKFNAAHPEILLNFVPHTRSYDFSLPELDAAIRFGEGAWPGAVSDYITGRAVQAICHPDLMHGKTTLREPADLARHTLLQHTSVPNAWQDWFAAIGIAHINGLIGPRFDQFSVLIQAAAAGLGIGLVPRCLVLEELAAGRVVAPFDLAVEARQGYFLCYPEDKRHLPALLAFRGWLLEEAERTN